MIIKHPAIRAILEVGQAARSSRMILSWTNGDRIEVDAGAITPADEVDDGLDDCEARVVRIIAVAANSPRALEVGEDFLIIANDPPCGVESLDGKHVWDANTVSP